MDTYSITGMETLIGLSSYFNFGELFELIEIGTDQVIWLSPLLLLLMFGMEIARQSDQSILGKADFGEAVSKIFWPTVLYLSYSVIGYFLIELIGGFHDYFMSIGSVKSAGVEYSKIISSVTESNGSFGETAVNVLNFGTETIAYLLFIGSFLVLIGIELFLKFGVVMLIVFMYLYGYIAIPTMKGDVINLVAGWKMTWIALALYAVIHGIFFLGITLLIKGSADLFTGGSGYAQNANEAGAYFFFSLTNGLMIGTEAVAIWMSYQLAANQGAMMAAMAPFAAVGAVMGNQFKKIIQDTGGSIDSPIVSGAKDKTSSAMNADIGNITRMGVGFATDQIGKLASIGNTGGGTNNGSNNETGGGSLQGSMGLSDGDSRGGETNSMNNSNASMESIISDAFDNPPSVDTPPNGEDR